MPEEGAQRVGRVHERGLGADAVFRPGDRPPVCVRALLSTDDGRVGRPRRRNHLRFLKWQRVQFEATTHKAGRQKCCLRVLMSLTHSFAHAWLCIGASRESMLNSIRAVISRNKAVYWFYPAPLIFFRCRCQWKSLTPSWPTSKRGALSAAAIGWGGGVSAVTAKGSLT